MVTIAVGGRTIDVGDRIVRIPMTWEEYLSTDTDIPGEYYGGAMVIRGISGKTHQRTIRRLVTVLEAAAPANAEILSEVGWSPDGIKEALIPDVLVFPEEDGNPDGPFVGVPYLVVEVLSTNRRDDLVEKMNRYAAWRATDYWIVDPRDRIVRTYRLEDGVYVTSGEFTGGRVTLTYADVAMPVDLDALFA